MRRVVAPDILRTMELAMIIAIMAYQVHQVHSVPGMNEIPILAHPFASHSLTEYLFT